MTGASPARVRRNAIASQRLAAAPEVIPTRPSLIERFRRWLEVRQLRAHRESVVAAYMSAQEELSFLRAKKFELPWVWLMTPMLDAQILAAEKDISAYESKLEELDSQISALCGKPINTTETE